MAGLVRPGTWEPSPIKTGAVVAELADWSTPRQSPAEAAAAAWLAANPGLPPLEGGSPAEPTDADGTRVTELRIGDDDIQASGLPVG